MHPSRLSRLVPLVLLLAPAVWLLLFAARYQPGPVRPEAQIVTQRVVPRTSSQPKPTPLAPKVLLYPPLTDPQASPFPKAFYGTVVRQVKLAPGEKLIALTFDDGPWPVTTEQVLDILHQHGARATFFWIGKNLERFPRIAQKVLENGHAVGDHTWSHRYGPVSAAAAAKEIDSTERVIAQDSEAATRLFRPPGGNLKNGLVHYALAHGYTVVMWSVSSADTDPKAPWTAFAENVLKGARPGTIVLMHDGGGNRSRTVQALPVILEGLQRQGYRFVTVPELLAAALPTPLEAKSASKPASPHLQVKGQTRTGTH